MIADTGSCPDAQAAGLVVLIEHLFLPQGENTCKSKNRPYMFGVENSKKLLVVVRPPCRQWDCPHCAEVLAKQWMLRCMMLVSNSDSEQSFDFVTLTMHEDLKTNKSTRAVFEDAWRKLYAALKRAQKDFSYVLVPELHKDGRMHVHMITSFHPPDEYFVHHHRQRNKQVRRMRAAGVMDRFWKDVPRAYGFGYANDQEPIEGDVAKVAGYIGKYLSKQRKVNQWPKGFKHVRASHDVPQLPEVSTPLDQFDWQMCMNQDTLQSLIHAAQQQGYRMIDPHSGEILSKTP
jgi:hypothetical protein